YARAARPVDRRVEQRRADAAAAMRRGDHQADVRDMAARRMLVARNREAADDETLVLRHEDGGVWIAPDCAKVPSLVGDVAPAVLLQLVELGWIMPALAVQVLALEVDARAVDRVLDGKIVRDDVDDVLKHRAAQAKGAGAADDEMRASFSQDDGRAHHRGEACSRSRRLREVELPDHVVDVDAGAGDDDARAGSGRRGQRDGVALAVDDRNVCRAL